MRKLAVIILAAGGSSRMGQAKQLLPIAGTSLIRKIATTALRVTAGKVLVVLGHAYAMIEKEISDLPLEIIENKEWKNGMSSSLRKGIEHLTALPSAPSHVMLLVCDQPYVSDDYLHRMIEQYDREAFSAVASAYKNTLGVPTIVRWEILQDYMDKKEDAGARHLIRQLAARGAVQAIDFPEGAFDLDTMEAYQNFIDQQSRS